MQHPHFPMSDNCIEEIESHGFYTIYLNGHFFILEVVPQTEEDRNTYLKKMCDEHSIGGGIYAYEMEENNGMGKTRYVFKKIRDTQGRLYAKMGTIKDRNSMDLTEAEDIKKRGGKNTQNYTKNIFTT